MNSIYESFYTNLIAEDRYRMILDGLQVTLLITVCAAVLGTQCQQVVEEPTERGFRVKPII